MVSTFRSTATVRPILARAFRMPCFSFAKRGAEEAERSMWASRGPKLTGHDAYPLAVKIRNDATFGYIEDINDENEEEDQSFDAKTLVGIVTEAMAEKERKVQMYFAYRRDDGDAQQAEAECCKVKSGEKQKRQTRLTGDDRRTGKTPRRPHQLVAVDGVGGAKLRRVKKSRQNSPG